MPSKKEERSSTAEADEEGAENAEPKGGIRALRYLFFIVWLFVVPLALALGSVRLLTPDSLEIDAGMIRTFVGEQQVPATILFFTAFAMLLWRFRYILPLAGSIGMTARPDLPSKLRARFDEAAQLLDDARRTMKTHERAIERELKAKERQMVRRALDQLEEAMAATPLHEQRFDEAFNEADRLVSELLSKWRKGELREYAESIGVAVAVALILRIFVIEAFKIPSGSMIPTLMIGDHIFVAKYAYGPLLPMSDSRLFDHLPPERGDVMVFKYPENPEQDFIKRVIALPGDTLEAIDGRPVINGWLAPSCYVGKLNQPDGVRGHLFMEYLNDKSFLTLYERKPNPRNIQCKVDEDCGTAHACRGGSCGILQGPYKVAPGEVWVMGDNRNNSHDSRSWNNYNGAGVPFQNIKGRAMFVWMSWNMNRMFVNVMGPPKLPPDTPQAVIDGLTRCQQQRPPIDQTTPPSASQANSPPPTETAAPAESAAPRL